MSPAITCFMYLPAPLAPWLLPSRAPCAPAGSSAPNAIPYTPVGLASQPDLTAVTNFPGKPTPNITSPAPTHCPPLPATQQLPRVPSVLLSAAPLDASQACTICLINIYQVNKWPHCGEWRIVPINTWIPHQCQNNVIISPQIYHFFSKMMIQIIDAYYFTSPLVRKKELSYPHLTSGDIGTCC